MTRPTRILVVDDEPAIHRFLGPSLRAADYEVVQATTAAEGARRLATDAPDLMILDLGLPDMDGKDLLRQVREWSQVPIVVLSARDREAEKIEALDLGADDFVNKPFGVGELLARIRAALRHRMQAQGETAVVNAGPVTIDVPRRLVTRHGAAVKLTPREFDLLAFLARNAGKVATHRQILAAVWGNAHQHDTQYLRVYVGQLRDKLEDNPGDPKLILTETGVGYRLNG